METVVIGIVAGIFIFLGNSRKSSTEMCKSSYTFIYIL